MTTDPSQQELDWVKASLEVKLALIDGLPCKRGVRRFLRELARFAAVRDPDNSLVCDPSVAELAEAMDCAESTVGERRRAAEADKYVDVDRTHSAFSRNVYSLQAIKIFNQSQKRVPKPVPQGCRNRYPESVPP